MAITQPPKEGFIIFVSVFVTKKYLGRLCNDDIKTFMNHTKVGKFGALGKEMRFKYLKNLMENNVIENSTVDGSSSRFSILPFRRIEKRRGRVPAEIESRGALIWHIEMLVSGSLHQFILGISHEALCIVVPYDGSLATGTESTSIELVPGTAVFSIPPRSILGWACLGDIDLEIYFGKGDSFQFSLKRKGEMGDLIQRLECASRGKSGLYPPAIKSKEVNVTRPSVGGQLGFHVAYEGFVNQVDNGSAANKARDTYQYIDFQHNDIDDINIIAIYSLQNITIEKRFFIPVYSWTVERIKNSCHPIKTSIKTQSQRYDRYP